MPEIKFDFTSSPKQTSPDPERVRRIMLALRVKLDDFLGKELMAVATEEMTKGGSVQSQVATDIYTAIHICLCLATGEAEASILSSLGASREKYAADIRRARDSAIDKGINKFDEVRGKYDAGKVEVPKEIAKELEDFAKKLLGDEPPKKGGWNAG